MIEMFPGRNFIMKKLLAITASTMVLMAAADEAELVHMIATAVSIGIVTVAMAGGWPDFSSADVADRIFARPDLRRPVAI